MFNEECRACSTPTMCCAPSRRTLPAGTPACSHRRPWSDTSLTSYTALARSAKVTTHLPALTARFAADRLLALAQAQGDAPRDVPEVLFVCVQNAGRSQMAAALLNHRAAGKVHVRSAGSAPAEAIHPTVLDAMTEVGIDLREEFPKPFDRRRRAGRGRRHHHGLRGRLPDLPRQAVRGLDP